MSRRLQVWLGWLFVVASAALLVTNVQVAMRNQDLVGEEDSPRVRPSVIAAVAGLSSMQVIRHTFATLYRLRVLAGHPVLIPGRLASLQFSLERVSRMHTQIVPVLTPLPEAALQRIDPQIRFWWAFDAESPVGVIAPRGPADELYVLAERADHQLYVFMPMAVYQQALGR